MSLLFASSFSGTQKVVEFSGGSVFGNGTLGGGTGACIDGTTSQAQSASTKSANITLLYAGYTFPAGHVWTGVELWGSTDLGFLETDASYTIRVWGHSSAPSNTTEATGIGTLLDDTLTGSDSNGIHIPLTSFANASSYTNIWITIDADSAGACVLAEMKFYETV
jgi:hypothetical protein